MVVCCERSIEGRHATTHRDLSLCRNASPPFVSWRSRLPELKRVLESGEVALPALAEYCQRAHHPGKVLDALCLNFHPAVINECAIGDVDLARAHSLVGKVAYH